MVIGGDLIPAADGAEIDVVSPLRRAGRRPRTSRVRADVDRASNVKPIWLELGGKTATIVFDDAVDLQAAAQAAAWAFFNQGERCSASSA